MNWLIVVPAWGQRHVDTCTQVVLPAIYAALTHISGPVRFMVHTDQPDRLGQDMQGRNVSFHGVPNLKPFHHQLSECHRQALRAATQGEVVAFVNGDMVPSIETFAAAETQMATGKMAIMMAGIRTIAGPELPPIGANSADLLRWSWSHRHPWIEGCIWGTGCTNIPSYVFFRNGDNVVLHAFHLHPFALRVDARGLRFGTTIDTDIANHFSHEEIHIVSDANEASFAEISPRDRDLGTRNEPQNIDSIVQWARHSANTAHRWFFTHPMTIQGNCADIDHLTICNQILERLNTTQQPSASAPAPQHPARERRQPNSRPPGTAHAPSQMPNTRTLEHYRQREEMRRREIERRLSHRPAGGKR